MFSTNMKSNSLWKMHMMNSLSKWDTVFQLRNQHKKKNDKNVFKMAKIDQMRRIVIKTYKSARNKGMKQNHWAKGLRGQRGRGSFKVDWWIQILNQRSSLESVHGHKRREEVQPLLSVWAHHARPDWHHHRSRVTHHVRRSGHHRHGSSHRWPHAP